MATDLTFSPHTRDSEFTLNPKTEVRDKPQITQISQMTEAGEFSAEGRKILPDKKSRGKRLWLFLL